LTRSRTAVLLGSQQPLYHLVPPAKSSAGQETIDLAASAGLLLDQHQQLVLHGALGEVPDRRHPGLVRWAAPVVADIEPRQNGKNSTITARQLGGLYLFEEPLQVHTAHRADTALDAFDRLCEVIDGSPDLRRRVKRMLRGNGTQSVELQRPRRRVVFRTRSKGAGRGIPPQVLYIDEAFYLIDLGAIVPSTSAQRNPQHWYSSSAPTPTPESESLRRLMRRGRAAAMGKAKAPGLAYFEWSAKVPPTADRAEWAKVVEALMHDPRAVAEANAALGTRLSMESVETMDRTAMTDEEYARERLGLVYIDEEEVADPAVPPADWALCKWPESKTVDPVVFAFEVSHDRAWSNVAVSALSTLDGRHVEIVENRPGTGWVVDRLIELRDAHSPTAVVCLPSGPAGGLLAEAETKGLQVGIPDGHDPKGKPKFRAVTAGDYAQACAAAYDDIVEHRWRHLGQPELDKAVAGAEQRKTGDTWVFDRRGDLDISPLSGVTLAAWVVSLPPEKPKTPEVHGWADDDEEFNAILRQLEAEEEADDGDGLDAP
jgi:hypothetical protein